MQVNGTEMELKQGMNLKDFLESQGYIVGHVAVEHNGSIVRKADLEEVILKNQDQLEIVKFVGGGCL